MIGLRGNYDLRAIAPGLPSGLALGRELLIVFESGSFGADDFLLQAVAHLKDLGVSRP